MKYLILVVCVHACLALPAVPDEAAAEIIAAERSLEPDGSYHYSYETQNGIKAHEDGQIENLDKDTVVERVSGGFEFETPEGEKVVMTYIADENGYQPIGSHIPVAPEIPEAIAKALKWAEAHPYVEDDKKH